MAEGRRPSTRERLLLESASTLAPHTSLERIDGAATAVTTTVTVVGALVASLGTIAATQTAGTSIGWALPTVVLVALSVACALLATMPAAATVRPGDLVEVERFFAVQLRMRGRLIRVAAYALSAAILLAPLPLVVAALRGHAASIALTARVSGADRRLLLDASASGLRPTDRLWVRSSVGGHVVAVAIADVEADGRASAALTLPPLRAGTRIAIEAHSVRPAIRRTATVQVPDGR